MKQVIVGGSSGNLVTTTTASYNCLMGSYSTWTYGLTSSYQCIPTGGTISRLFVRLSGDPTNADSSYTFALYLNGAAQALTCTIAAGSTTGSDIDPAHAITVAAGDIVCLRCIASATAPVARFAQWTTMFEGSTAGESICLVNMAISSTAGLWYEIQGSICSTNIGTSEVLVQCPMPTKGTFKKMYVVLSATPGTGKSYTIALNVGGISKNNTVTITGPATTGNSGAATDAVNAGDLIDYQMTYASAPSSVDAYVGIVFVSDTDGESLIFGGSPYYNPSTSATNFHYFGAFYKPAWDATASNVYSLIQACTIRNLYVALSVAPYVNSHTDDYYIISIDKNAGAASGLTVQITDLATSGSDLVNSYSPTDGDTIDIKSVPNSTPAATKVHIGLVCYIASGWSHKIMGVTPVKIFGIAKASILKVNGV